MFAGVVIRSQENVHLRIHPVVVVRFILDLEVMSGLTSAFQNPQLSTAIGLIKYAQAVQAERPQRRGFGRIFSRFIPGMR